MGLKILRTNSAKCEKHRLNLAIRVNAVHVPYPEEQPLSARKSSHIKNTEHSSRMMFDKNVDNFVSFETKDESIHDAAPEATKSSWHIPEKFTHPSSVPNNPETLSTPNYNTVSGGSSRPSTWNKRDVHIQGGVDEGTKGTFKTENALQFKINVNLAKRPVPTSSASKSSVMSLDNWCAPAKSAASVLSSSSSSSQIVSAETRIFEIGDRGPHTTMLNAHAKSERTDFPRVGREIDPGAGITNFSDMNNFQRDDGESSTLSLKRIRHAGNFYLED